MVTVGSASVGGGSKPTTGPSVQGCAREPRESAGRPAILGTAPRAGRARLCPCEWQCLQPPASLTGADGVFQIGKLRSELEMVSGNVRVMSEMLTELVPTQAEPADLELLQVSTHPPPG